MAFQLIDDVLDYSAKQATLGKTIGDDFREGKMTLPVVLALRRGHEAERAFWRRTIEELEQGDDDLQKAITILKNRRALADTVERARGYGLTAGPRPRVVPGRRGKASAARRRRLLYPARLLSAAAAHDEPSLPSSGRRRYIASRDPSECSSAW